MSTMRASSRRIKFGGSEDGQDVVDVEVAVDPHCLSALPEQREKVVKDVVYAVRRGACIKQLGRV